MAEGGRAGGPGEETPPQPARPPSCPAPARFALAPLQVEFPARPQVSAEVKAFIQRCLAYRQQDRWDVLTAAADTYLQLKR